MPTNNTMSDIKYKISLRARAEWELTQFTQQPDNPAGLTSADVTAFAEYRKAWKDLMDGDMSQYSIDASAEMLIKGITIPEIPEGWQVMVRVAGDLPPILVRTDWCDLYDATLEGLEDETGGSTSGVGVSAV